MSRSSKTLLYVIGLAFAFSANALAQTYDLPIIFIDTKGKCLNKDIIEKIPATMSVLDGATNNVADSAKGTHYEIGIKVRGQSSALFPKPGYGVEVRDDKGEGTDVSLLGLPPAEDWVFHGPYVDKSMMRNALAHWLFRQAGRYSPRTKHFDLYINGVYRGVYVLIEKIKRGKYRVDVSKLKETDIAGDSLTGGYIWAYDKTGTNTGGAGDKKTGGIEAEGFRTADGLNVILHYPKKANIQPQQEQYLKKYLDDLEGLFTNGKNGNGYDKYVDVGSAVDYVLHQELTDNGDSYWCSFFLHKPKDKGGKDGKEFKEGKVTLGPPWDFNLAMGNSSMMGGNGNSWQIEGKSGGGMWGGGWGGWGGGGDATMNMKAPIWLSGMWKDANYQSELKKRWAELRSGVWHTKTIDTYLDSMKTYLAKAADRNFKRWPNLGKSSGQGDADPEPMKFCTNSSSGGMGMGGNNANTWDGEYEYLRKKIKSRLSWMDQKLGFTEPAQPIVTEPIIHIPDWEREEAEKNKGKDTIQTQNPDQPPVQWPPIAGLDDFSRLSPTNYFTVKGDRLEIQTDLGGTFALVDLNGVTLFKTKIKKGVTTLKVPRKAQNKHWIATLNGKMMNR